MNKKNILIIIGIFVICAVTIAGTVAYYREVLFNDLNTSTITHGLDYYINYTKGQNITAATINAGSSYTDGANTGIVFWKKDNTYDIYGHIYLDVNQIGTHTAASSSLKYTLVNGGSVIAQGTFNRATSGSSITLAKNIALSTTSQTYTVYIWIDQNEEIDVNMENEVLSLTVRCEATMKTI